MHTVPRLLEDFIPTHYQLELTINRVGRSFSGKVTIDGQSVAGKIALHAHELEITKITVDGVVATHTVGTADEIYISNDSLAAGEHQVTVEYNGQITDSLHGLYPCYFEADGVKKELLLTQFESHYAREVFPCIDEPAAKATFTVTVTTEQNVTVLGNMPVVSQTNHDDSMITSFETTPRMSTYLLALVIGEMQSKSATTASGVEVSVWATTAQPASGLDFALRESVDIIEFFDKYFGVPYPLPKIDHVAVPDFGAGAMENWGLITYRETALIADPTHSSLETRQYISSVIAHELSHQWFGNLVTMKWWNNLWLNESFASIMENIAPNALHPEWQVWNDFNTSEAISALRRDSIDGVQSVQTDVQHPDEIQSIFDGAIVYAKGARLLRMMIEYIGETAFKTGLTNYFNQHAYGNTDENDLWRAMKDASNKDVTALMSAWISQSGYPLVYATLEDNRQLHLKQEQFFIGQHEKSSKIWPIPLDANQNEIPALMTESTIDITITNDAPIILNQNNSAHFITHYDDRLFARLTGALRAGELNVSQRLQLLNEQLLLSRGSQISPSRLIDILPAYAKEDQEPVWSVLVMTINELKKYVENNQSAENNLRRLAGELARPQFERLGWKPITGESENDQKLRSLILAQMIYSRDQSVIEQAISYARATDINQLDPELRSLLLSTDVSYGDNPQLAIDLIGRYRQEVSPEIRQDISTAITSARDEAVIAQILDKLTDTDIVRPQDNVFWYINLQSNRYARAQTWAWLQANWQWIEKKFSSDKSYDYYPRYAGQLLMTRQQLTEFKTFFLPMLDNPGLKRTIEMGITDLTGRVEMIENNQADVCEKLINL